MGVWSGRGGRPVNPKILDTSSADRAAQFASLKWVQKCADRIIFNEFNDTCSRNFILIEICNSFK
jgi:hypothetical protein